VKPGARSCLRSVAALAVAVAAWTVAPAAFAQDPPASPPPVVVNVQPGVPALSPDALRDAIARELGVPAVAPTSAPATGVRGTLTVALDPERRILITYRDAAGHEVWRVISRPTDAAAALATIAFIAGNLARQEADELAAQLRPAQPPTPPPPPPPPPTTPVIVSPPLVIVVPAPGATSEPQPVTVVSAPVVMVGARPLRDAVSTRRLLSDPNDPHAGHMAIYFTPLMFAASSSSLGAALNVGMSAYRWRHVSLGVEAGYLIMTGGNAVNLLISRTAGWAMPLVQVHAPVGRFRFEGGLGLGLSFGTGTVTAFTTSVSSVTRSGVGAAFQLFGGVAAAISRRFDFFLRVHMLASSVAVETTPVCALLNLGMQVRFL
jgi:hypothetical protein